MCKGNKSADSPFSHTEPPRPAGHLQLKSLPSFSQVPPCRQGWELQGFLWCSLPRTWATVVAGGGAVVVGASVVVVVGRGVVTGAEVVVVRLP